MAASARATQIRLFHGLVPAVVALDEVSSLLGVLGEAADDPGESDDPAWSGLLLVARRLLEQATHLIESQSTDCGYPLHTAIANYRASGADLNTLSQMQDHLASQPAVDWDGWASTLNDSPDDPAA